MQWLRIAVLGALHVGMAQAAMLVYIGLFATLVALIKNSVRHLQVEVRSMRVIELLDDLLHSVCDMQTSRASVEWIKHVHSSYDALVHTVARIRTVVGPLPLLAYLFSAVLITLQVFVLLKVQSGVCTHAFMNAAYLHMQT